MQMTEKTPETDVGHQSAASLIPEANHCITANVPPAHSAAGHTSNASFHVPPSIFTNVATSQNGTRIDTNGKLAAGHRGQRDLVEAAHGGQRDDRRADRAPRDRCGVGEQVQHGGLERLEAESRPSRRRRSRPACRSRTFPR